MKLNRVLVVFKRRVANASGRRRGAAWARQITHEKALKSVLATLTALRIEHRTVDRESLKNTLKADLIIAVGGDGTLIASAHAAGDTPVLGLNSMPGYSVGFFCAADIHNFKKIIKRICSGKFPLIELPLMEARVDGMRIAELALNDILFAGQTPADMARYTIKVGRGSEEQKSSGIWIAAGPGSTAATGSAGGKRTPIASNRLQFIVREPYLAKNAKLKLKKGILAKDATISIIPDMTDSKIYIDGPKLSYSIPLGSKLTVRVSNKRLKIFL